MMKIETTAPLLQYEQPTSKEFNVRAGSMICISNPDFSSGYIDDVDEEDLGTL